MSESIHPETAIGAVYLTVTDLERMLEFYQHIIGFTLQQREGDAARLGASDDGPSLLVLIENRDAPHVQRTTGLYHFAILTPSRFDLARSLKHLSETRKPLQGFADHWVSEAIYLPDPEGNGIEIYRDRPRGEWIYSENIPQMASDPIDLDGILAELDGRDVQWTGLHPQTVIGHMHLHVAHIDEAEAFYHEVIGFDLMLRYGPTASFLSAGGYHHHIGVNTWAGVGAPPPPAEAAGLRFFTVLVPDTAELNRIADRVKRAGVAIEEIEEGLLVRDPSLNAVVFTIKT
jgi:catechol 2,3-dioxygenase